ncbi:uncharacterized protein SPPG_05538 [Spizellomyces punctatus DAOM BR117]|uniref:COP9 signalosome complex subunit 6 n=1 Tax=Spizellomyces punctatus (strain DAOM BR117) TaxID=645134 RepID=A0A0L0HE81_SPIPD|nr:uncharacterized protein SPPG_05538 [Spizellomyces punctatus DAOM BR117]KNC99284.1 hypothetical protein SPPG_05538 [Spizellomyces punctatus DAOM BR117]|eukprot:XP_016607324.1 hypothetical protein SPPG_05538 [Spizellomyces punctatus DAOM BR117]
MATAMETDEVPFQTTKVVSDAASASGLIITLHALVIINISDQWTRTKMQQGDVNPIVIGALLGTQSGREIEIFDSYELPFTIVDEKPVMDKVYFVSKQEQLRQVFPTYDFLGWYSTGAQPSATELHLHQQMIGYNESPLFLQLNPLVSPTAKDFPISVYESIIDLVGGQAQLLFLKSQYKIETGEAERIAVDHVAHVTNASTDKGSTLITHLVGQRNAIKMLHARIRLIHEYVSDVESGKIPRDHNIMRQIASLANRLPTIDSPEFQEEFLVDYNDVLLMTYLATITKGTSAISELVEKFNMVGPKRPGGFPRGPAAYLG